MGLVMDGMVLIADDVATNRILLKATFGDAGYTPILTSAKGDCLQRAAGERPDGIVLALDLAAADNLALLSRLKADPRTRDIPVIVLTSSQDVALRLRALEIGADDVFSLPVDGKVLLARFRNLLRSRQAYAGLTDGPEAMLFGIEEEGADFTLPGALTILSDRPDAAEALSRQLRPLMAERICIAGLAGFLQEADPGASAADIYLVDGSGDGEDPARRLLPELRSRMTSRHAGICLMTGQNRPDQATMALDLGADAIIDTATHPEEVAARLRRLLVRKRQSDRTLSRLQDGLRLAMVDPLTGLFNRRYAMAFLAELSQSARRSGQPYAILLADLDRFKSVNDRFGHATGDQVLIEVAQRLTGGLRREDLVARIGGEEFLIILPDQSVARAEQIARTLCRLIEERPVAHHRNEPVHVTASIGLAVWTPGEDFALAGSGTNRAACARGHDLIERADRALLRSKQAGRNHVTVN